MSFAPNQFFVEIMNYGEVVSFESLSDLQEAFKQTKCLLFRNSQKSKESKRRGARFLLACLDSGHIKDPGGKVRGYCNSILN